MTQTPMPAYTAVLFKSWMAVEKAVPGLLSPITTEAQHEQALQVVDALMTEIGNELGHPLLSLLTLLADRVEVFEQAAYPLARASPEHALAFLMEQRGLNLEQLEADTGIDGRHLSRILRGVHTLSAPQIETLSAYFHVSPEVFIA